MKEQLYSVAVNNVPADALEYIVARWSAETASLWYWGSWDNKPQAEEIAKFLDGVVVRRINNESV